MEIQEEGGRGSNCARRLGNRCLEGSKEAMEGMDLQRAVSAYLQLGGRSRDKLHVVSCYDPTRAASRQEKNTSFFLIE